jgi:hypothetical protein
MEHGFVQLRFYGFQAVLQVIDPVSDRPHSFNAGLALALVGSAGDLSRHGVSLGPKCFDLSEQSTTGCIERQNVVDGRLCIQIKHGSPHGLRFVTDKVDIEHSRPPSSSSRTPQWRRDQRVAAHPMEVVSEHSPINSNRKDAP